MAAKKKTEAQKVKIGQVWRDRDERSKARWLVVLGIDGPYAVCGVHVEAARGVDYTGRTTCVRLDRFRPTSTGYELVERVGARAVVAS